jgi:hypothetical protein
MPTTFPAHQGLILPLARRWPSYFDVIALFVGAAKPDLVDITFGFLLNGYFKPWFGHTLIGVPFNIFSGLLLTWLVKASALYVQKNGIYNPGPYAGTLPILASSFGLRTYRQLGGFC